MIFKIIRNILFLSLFTILASCCNAPKENKAADLLEQNKKSKAIISKDNIPYFLSDYTFGRYNGKHFSFKEVKGKVLLLSFWATWCGSFIKRH